MPILCKETEFIIRGNDFRQRSRDAIELRVLRGARTRVPVPRARVSYLERLNNAQRAREYQCHERVGYLEQLNNSS